MAQPSDWGRFLAAIRAQESGGNYTEDVSGCLGAYCWNAQGNWDTMAKAAGQSQYVGVNPSQVPGSVQDTVASTNLYRIYQQAGGGTGGLSAAARWWNGGTTSSVPNPGLPSQQWAPKCGGGSSGAYACQVLTRMGLGGHYLAGGGTGTTAQGGSGSGGVVLTAAQQADCALGFNGNIPVIPGVYSQTVNFCLVTKPQARAVVAVAVLVSAGILGIAGLAFTAIFSGPGRQVLQLVAGGPGKAAAFVGQVSGATAATAASEQQGAAVFRQQRAQQRAAARQQQAAQRQAARQQSP